MKNKFIIGGLIIFAVFLTVITSYAFTNKRIDLVNPNGEQVFIDENGKIFTQYVAEIEETLGGTPTATTTIVEYATDIVGTKVGTSTTGVGFYEPSAATSSYPIFIGNRDLAIYTIKILGASTTNGANIRFEIDGSFDDFCNTASSTYGILDPVLIRDINWYSAGDHLKNKVHSTSFGNSSSTASLLWDNPVAGASNEIILTDLNYRCLRLNVKGSSTITWVQLRTK